ncbi:MAG: lytic transglycosylase domain-containing protein [Candidatus Pacearchaeota archaeon]
MRRRIRKKGKKGLLPKFVVGLVIGMMVIAGLLFLIAKIAALFLGSTEEEKAKATLEGIRTALLTANLRESKSYYYLLQPLEDWILIFMPKNIAKTIEGQEKPSIYFNEDVVCLCKKEKCKYCFPYKPIQDKDNNYLKVKLDELKSITFYDQQGFVIYSLHKEIIFEPKALSKQEKKKAKDVPEEIKDVVNELAKEGKIKDRALLLAIMYRESGYNKLAVSEGGAAGLMQLVPATALSFGLKVVMKNKTLSDISFKKSDGSLVVESDGKRETISAVEGIEKAYREYMNKNDLWTECNWQKVSPCNSCFPTYCNYVADERFDVRKSIEAGASYIDYLLEKFKGYGENEDYKFGYVIAAYHEGEGKIIETCQCQNGICSLPLDECLKKLYPDEQRGRAVLGYVNSVASLRETLAESLKKA